VNIRWRVVTKIAVSTVLLAVIVLSLDAVADVGRLMAGAAPGYVALAFLVLTADRFLMSFKWLLLLKSRGLQLPLLRSVQIYCSAMIWGMFMPATVGADVIRGYMTSRHGLDGYEVFASITVERLVGFVASLLFGLAGILILSSAGATDERFDSVWWIGALATLSAAAALILSFNEGLFTRALNLLSHRIGGSRIVQRLRRFHEVYRGYGEHRAIIGMFFALTLIEQCLVLFANWIVALALHIDVSLSFMAGAVALAMLIARLPVSIDGLGVYEGVMVLIMGLVGISAAEAVALSLAGRFIQIVLWLPWWFVYTVQWGLVRPPKGIAHS